MLHPRAEFQDPGRLAARILLQGRIWNFLFRHYYYNTFNAYLWLQLGYNLCFSAWQVEQADRRLPWAVV
jgi:hypothetical protein